MQPFSGNQRPDVLTSVMPRDMHLSRSSSNVPRLPSFFGTTSATKPSRFAHFWQGAESLAPRATTSEPSKVVRACGAFNILTWKRASRHNGAHFFDISTSKSASKPVCFVGFDFEICFAPQRCPLFRHVNFQKCSDTEVLCTFWLGHVLRATTACIFSTVARACATLRMTWPHFCVAGAALYTDGVENRKTHWHEAVSSALNFPFLKEVSQNCLVFWLSFWCRQLRKLKEVSQNCFVFDVANFENWGSLAEVLRFWCCQVQNWGSLAE